jgi:hypothetical protein
LHLNHAHTEWQAPSLGRDSPKAGAPAARLLGQEPKVGFGAETAIHPILGGNPTNPSLSEGAGHCGGAGWQGPELPNSQKVRIRGGTGYDVLRSAECVEETPPGINSGGLRIWFAGDSIRGRPFVGN